MGNVMIDTLLKHRKDAAESRILERLGLAAGGFPALPYCVLTLHRPATVDDRDTLREVLDAMTQIAGELPIIFPIHPRTKSKIDAFGFHELFCWASTPEGMSRGRLSGIIAIEPLGYLDFLQLMSHARCVLTDSGGIQEETTILGISCVTLRDSTERPVTITQGTNVLAGTGKESILSKTISQLKKSSDGSDRPALWDGRAAERIVDILAADTTGPG